MLTIDTLHQAYGGSHILRGLSFEVKTGEVTTLLGRNGVGKTTLLKSLMGLVKTKSGSITFDGGTLATTATLVPAFSAVWMLPVDPVASMQAVTIRPSPKSRKAQKI